MARPLFDSEYLFGIHEPGGEQYMLDANRPGWIVFTEGIGQDPANQSGRDYRSYSDRGIGVLARLNHGYEPQGTIPTSDRYAAFAQRCANFVANSQGCKLWIIGNEMNFAVEWPRRGAQPPLSQQQPAPAATPAVPSVPAESSAGASSSGEGRLSRVWRSLLNILGAGDSRRQESSQAESPLPAPPAEPAMLPPGATPLPPDEADPFHHGDPRRFSALLPTPAAIPGGPDGPMALPADAEVITPAKYAECYRLCREAILSVPGHANDQVLIGAVAPWNIDTTYPGNASGDWVLYLRDILTELGPEGCDGITIHTYTHGVDKNLIYSDAKLDSFPNYHYHFYAYRDFMGAIPANMRHLPVYLTETDQNDPWLNQNNGWIQAAYGEINHWNAQPGNQQIRNMILYRWPQIDKWYIEGKHGVVDGFRQSLQQDYKWRAVMPPRANYGPGDRLSVREAVKLRRSPGFRGKPGDDVVTTLDAGTRLTVLDAAPASVDDLVWWKVQAGSPGAAEGWLAQFNGAGQPFVRLMEKSAVVSPGTDDGIDAGARVTTLTIVRLRRSIGYRNKPEEDTVAFIPAGAELVVTGPARQKDELTWWPVRGIDDDQQPVSGWMAESAPGGDPLIARLGDVTPPDVGDNGDGGRFAPGDRIKALDIVRLRRSPGYADKPADDTLGYLPVDTSGPVLDGPRTVDGLVWWKVRMTLDSGETREGWAAESAPGGVMLLAAAGTDDGDGSDQPGGALFSPGANAVTQNVVRMRKTPGYTGKGADDLVVDAPMGAVVTIVAGPRTVDGLTWWQADASVGGQAFRGWMAESAPGGELLLRLMEGPRPADGVFPIGALIQTHGVMRIRNAPGHLNKPDDDVLGALAAKTTVYVIAGPREQDGLIWYQIGGVAVPAGEIVGWGAQAAPDGVALLGYASRLPGTDIPDLTTKSYLAAPYRGNFGISQLWGERPQVYSQFSYEGVSLRGHNGIDFLTPMNTLLQAVDDGVVAEAVFNDPTGFGHYVLLHHAWGESIYAHMEAIDVQPGQTVSRGQLIGRSGTTGNSQGPHLHFSIRINPYQRTDGWGGFSDPLPYLPPASFQLPAYITTPPGSGPAPQHLGLPPTGRDPISTAPGMNPDQPGLRRP
ncbi:MAG: M23 family metallopeptidase [Caldilineaceae bacterium]|nr:M23 family metallopeptidase [Caldilineaceae bacterium]